MSDPQQIENSRSQTSFGSAIARKAPALRISVFPIPFPVSAGNLSMAAGTAVIEIIRKI